MPNLYVLLTRSPTLVSKTVHLFTGDAYTHASIAYDDALSTLCSFTRRYPAFPLPAGLAHENTPGSYLRLHPYMQCVLLRLEATDEVYGAVRRKIEEMLAEKEKYRFSIGGLFRCRMGLESKLNTRYFCSYFVAYVLETCGAATLPRSPSLMRPQDFLALPGLERVYEGRMAGLLHRRSRPNSTKR